MAVQQLIWIVLVGVVIVNGFPVKSPQSGTEDERLNYEKYVRQLEKKHKFAYNDIDQPWQSISSDHSVENDSHEFVLKQDDVISVQPLVRDTKHQTSESPVADKIVPVTDAGKQQVVALTDIVADVEATTVQEKILAVPEENIPVTTTQEKLLPVAEDDGLSVTTTQEKLLADEILVQSESATEQEVATIIPANEPVEESTALPVVKDTLAQESLVKVAQVEETEISEGSGQSLIESANTDEGSGAAEVFKIEAEESTSTDALVKEIQTTIQPEISNDEAAIGTEATLLLNKDGLAGEEKDLAITTEVPDTKLATIGEQQQLDEKEVKSTDSPSADEAEQTEIQPSSTIKIAHADDSIEAVTTDSTLVVSDVRLDSTASDLKELEESTTLVSVVLKGEILADEATQEITTEQPDSHPNSTQSGF